jgi:DnaK suppressor protein
MRAPMMLAATLTREQCAVLHAQLLEQKSFREEQLRELRQDRPATDGTEREIADALAVAAETALRDVVAALDRMADGSYGLCIDCRAPMPPVRLEVLPQVARCMPCQRQAEVG